MNTQPVEFVRAFTGLSKNDAHLAGGKGASLGEMSQAGIPVPPGFVVLSESFEHFIHETDLVQEIDAILGKVNHKEIHTVEAASEQIKELILSREMPADIATDILSHFKELGAEYVAVRSSATAEDGKDHAWAGQLESYLNIKEAGVLEKVRHCWASLFTPRAIFYRFEKGLHSTKISVAVVVQKMVNSERSGIAFSVHPVTEDYNQLIIEAGFGLGEAIVSGSVTPDSYVVEKEPRNILDINVSTQDRALYRVTAGGNEWRDIPEPQASSQVLTNPEVLALSEIILQIENHYGFPCDIEWAYEAGKFYIVQSRPITTLAPKKTAPESVISSLMPADHYFTLGQWVSPVLEYEMWISWSSTEDARRLGIADPRTAIAVNGAYFLTTDGTYTKVREIVSEEFQKGTFELTSKILGLCESISAECIELAKQLDGKKITFPDFTQAVGVMKRLRLPWMLCFAIGEAAEKYFQAKGVVTEIPQLENSLNDDQKALSQFKNKLGNSDWKTFADIEKNDPVLAKEVLVYAKKTEYIGTHHFWGAARNLELFLDAVKHASDHADGGTHSVSNDERVNVVAKTTKWRLESAQSSAKLAFVFRSFLTDIAKSIKLTYEDIIFLLTQEIEEVIKNKTDFTELIRARQKGNAIILKDGNIVVVTGEELSKLEHFFGLNKDHGKVEEITGAIGNKGKVTGRVVIVLKPSDQSKVEPGIILVAPETTPDYISAMGKAAAFVTDQGGITSHAAIVAREMKKPCVIGTKIATKVLKDGDMVEVDAEKGIVRILKNEPADPTKIGGKDWRLVVTRNMSHWHNILSLRGHAFNTKDFGIDVPCLWLYVAIDSTRTSVFMEPGNLGVYSKAVMEAFSTKEKVAAIKKKYQEIVADALEALRDADKNLNLKTWAKFLEAYQRLTPGLMITTNFGRGGTEKIIELLKKKGTEENEIHQIVSAVTYPPQHTPLFDSQLALMQIGAKIQNGSLKDGSVEVELSQWLEEYGCIPVNFCEEPWNMQDARLQLESVTKKECEKELAKAVEDHDRKTEEKEAIFKKINDPELEIIASALAEATYLNEFRKNAFCRISLGYRGMFTKIAAMGGSQNWRDVFYLTPEEATSLLAGATIDISKLVSERRLAGAYINDEGKEIYLDQSTLNNLELFIRATYTAPKASVDSVDFVKGFSANRGKVKGIARIILSSKDFGNLKPNEILVTTMTSVDFVPVMERAAAFVTNEGGITSHAAIVAREMNKPCVIGTKNATQVIKDGDMVEVDAEKGIVRKIS